MCLAVVTLRRKAASIGVDGDPSNNRLENLRWDTRSENMLDINRYGCHPNTARTHCPRQHLLVMPNLVRCLLPGRALLACNRAQARRARPSGGAAIRTRSPRP